MDIDRNFLEEMLIMEEDKERLLTEKLVYIPSSEEAHAVNLTAAERHLLDSVLLEVITGGSRRLPLSTYDSLALRRIRDKLDVKNREKANAI